jgi:hypothetical protein
MGTAGSPEGGGAQGAPEALPPLLVLAPADASAGAPLPLPLLLLLLSRTYEQPTGWQGVGKAPPRLDANACMASGATSARRSICRARGRRAGAHQNRHTFVVDAVRGSHVEEEGLLRWRGAAGVQGLVPPFLRAPRPPPPGAAPDASPCPLPPPSSPTWGNARPRYSYIASPSVMFQIGWSGFVMKFAGCSAAVSLTGRRPMRSLLAGVPRTRQMLRLGSASPERVGGLGGSSSTCGAVRGRGGGGGGEQASGAPAVRGQCSMGGRWGRTRAAGPQAHPPAHRPTLRHTSPPSQIRGVCPP